MSRLGEKVAYLKGLAEGLRLDGETDQGKLLLAMIDAMDAFAAEVEEQEAELAELREYVEEIDSDVGDLEEAFLSVDDEDEDDDFEDEDDEDDDDDELIEYECPHCGTVIFFDGEAFDMEEEHLCPNCHRSVSEEDENEAQEDDEE